MSMTLETIRAAHARIAPYIVQTPLLRLPALDDALGCEVYVKAECMQRTGAFKLRGAMNKILALTDAERARGFVAASSGNHGRAVAYAAQRFAPGERHFAECCGLPDFGGNNANISLKIS